MPPLRRIPGILRTPGMGERAYTYAKACGIIGKSFVGKRTINLERVSRLSELDRMVFPAASGDLPEKELLPDLEKRITERAVNSIVSIVDSFSNPPEFLTLLVRGYEYTELSNAISSSMEKEKNAKAYSRARFSGTNLGRFQTVRFDAWPDIRAMIEGTEFAFLLEREELFKDDKGAVSLQTVLDQHYYNALWKSLFALPLKDRFAGVRILSEEISLKNCCWALRLRTYYGMAPDEVKSHLIDIRVKGKKSLAGEAIQCLEFPLDSIAAWSPWRWKRFLNSESAGRHWNADPRYFQNAASRYLCRLARHYFRLNPFSLNTIFCFVKLKQFEEDLLTSGAEGLSIGMSGSDILSMLGVES